MVYDGFWSYFILSPWIMFYIWVQWISSSSLFMVDIVSDLEVDDSPLSSFGKSFRNALAMILISLLLSWNPRKKENQKEKRQFKTDSAFPALCNKRQNGMKDNAEIKSHPVQSKILQPLLQFRNIRIIKTDNIDNEKKESQSFSPHATLPLCWIWGYLISQVDGISIV